MSTRHMVVGNRTLVRSVSALFAAACLSTAGAETSDPKYTMAAISDAAYGEKILAGKYDEAIGKIKKSNRLSIHDYYSATNLCVAYVVTRDIANASEACDSAVAEMQEMLDRRRRGAVYASSRKAYRKYLAIALSNRGVLRAINGDSELARADFLKAMQLEAKVPAPATNMERLEQEGAPNA